MLGWLTDTAALDRPSKLDQVAEAVAEVVTTM